MLRTLKILTTLLIFCVLLCPVVFAQDDFDFASNMSISFSADGLCEFYKYKAQQKRERAQAICAQASAEPGLSQALQPISQTTDCAAAKFEADQMALWEQLHCCLPDTSTYGPKPKPKRPRRVGNEIIWEEVTTWDEVFSIDESLFYPYN